MPNPNQLPSANNKTVNTDWDSLSEVEFAPLSVSTDEVSKITLSESPANKNGLQNRNINVTDASGMERRTSNLILGYNKRGVQIGETYLSVEQFREKALESLEEDTNDEILYYVRKDTGKQFAEPRQVVDDMLAAIIGAGPEAVLSDNNNVTNQDARSVEFGGPNGETQHGIMMLGNEGIQMPNGTYAEINTIDSAMSNYAKAIRKEAPVSPVETPLPPKETSPAESSPAETPPAEQAPVSKEIDSAPKKDLHQATLELAELYAKNRRLVAGPGNREKFEAAKQEYQQLLAEHLSNQGHAEYDAGFKTLSGNIQTIANELAAQNLKELTAFAGGDLEHPTKTPEEIEAKREELRRAAEAKMKENYPSMVDQLETTITSKTISEYTKARIELEDATINALDNGTACRKAVSKIITNKWVKRGLTVAAAAGLAVAAVGIGRGVADGSLAVTLGYTAGGIAAGAARGGLSGALMSRQDSKTSAIRSYNNDIAKNVEDRVNAGQHITAEQLAAEAMSDYTAANQADLRSNRIKTAVSAGIGAALGAAASGIHVENVTSSTTTEQVQTGVTTEQVQTGTTTEQVQTGFTTERIQTGTTPEQYNVDLSKIDIQKGSGMGETFADLGGDPAKLSEAIKIAQEFDSQYGMVPGSNGVVAGVNGQVGKFAHTYPGTIDKWPQEAREYITKVAQKWAENGLIESTKTGGEPVFTTIEKPILTAVEKPIFSVIEKPVFSTVEKTVISYLPNLFYNALIQAEATAASGVIGGALNPAPKTTEKTSADNAEQPEPQVNFG